MLPSDVLQCLGIQGPGFDPCQQQQQQLFDFFKARWFIWILGKPKREHYRNCLDYRSCKNFIWLIKFQKNSLDVLKVNTIFFKKELKQVGFEKKER